MGVERTFLDLAIELAKKCRPEDERPHPKVGCVIIKDGRKIAEAYRNQFGDCDHAESTALRNCSEDPRNAILITTLEPCITRRHKMDKEHSLLSCKELIIHYGIRKVICGMLDPNPNICGKKAYMNYK